MHITIDSQKCMGHGRCYSLAGDLFGEDGEGFGVVKTASPAGAEDKASLAVRSCPEHAITLSDDAR
jgi:ferredoxin